jgi:hypothetical protein
MTGCGFKGQRRGKDDTTHENSNILAWMQHWPTIAGTLKRSGT